MVCMFVYYTYGFAHLMLKAKILYFYVLVVLLSRIIYLQRLWLGNCKSNIFYIVIFAQLIKK